MSSTKQRMSNFKFRAILVPIISFLFIVTLILTILAGIFDMSLDTFLGRGKRSVIGSDLAIAQEDLNFYDQKYDTTDKSRAAAAEVALKLGNEGIVMLKNDNDTLPLKKKGESGATTVSIFGHSYLNPVYGGTGSGMVDLTEDYIVTAEEAMNSYFNINTLTVSAMKSAGAKIMDGEAVGFAEGGRGADNRVDYYDTSVFDTSAIKASCTGTVGVVFIGRKGGEGGDIYSGRERAGYNDGTRHQLTFIQEELKTIKFAKENCDKVVLIINSSNVMETGIVNSGEYAVDSIIMTGGPGAKGFESMAKILCGEVNPSGKTVDIWAADFWSDPTFANFGDYQYSNVTDFKQAGGNYLEYEEGIYFGYKYYETLSADGGDCFKVFDRSNQSYGNAVIYPFGYGLSFDDASVTQTLKSVEYKDDTVTVKGTITNSSTKYDAKEVVQIYWGADYKNIERAAKNLVAFEKFDVSKGSSKDFTISFSVEDMTSYDYKGHYSDGKGSYVLESGEYDIYLGRDSHNSWGSKTITVNNNNVYLDKGKATNDGKLVGKRESDKIEATNVFSEVSKYMETSDITMLTRKSGLHNSSVSAPKGTFTDNKVSATYVTNKAQSAEIAKATAVFDPFSDESMGNDSSDEAPIEKAANGLTISQLRGVDYNDPRWDPLLDQLDYSAKDLIEMLSRGAYNTGAVKAVGKSKTEDHDGPQGWSLYGGDKVKACAWVSEVVVAQTWSKELAKEMGEAVGQEALTLGFNGWYAPAMNLHRSPFGGRNFEYYSEDATLSGYIGAAVTEGAMSTGTYVYLKHFGVCEQEVKRKLSCTWATEQALREMYLKPFEICIKTAETEMKYIDILEDGESYQVKTKPMMATTGIMTASTRIGPTWSSGNKALLTDITRDEWGFIGTIETDMNAIDSIDQVLRAGGDIYMTFKDELHLKDSSSNTFKNEARRAVKNVLYTYVNSNTMQGVPPGGKVVFAYSPWLIGLIIANIVIYLFVVAVVVLIVLRTLDEKKNPDKYKRKKTVKTTP